MEIPINSNPEGKKYILTDHTCQVEGHTLYRIRALKDFAGVRAGELGGYVAGEHNLAQYGNCWICNNAIVYENATVKDNARVSDFAVIRGNARLTDFVCVCEDACIDGDVTLSGDTIVKGNSHISTQIEANKIIKPCSLNEISKENSL